MKKTGFMVRASAWSEALQQLLKLGAVFGQVNPELFWPAILVASVWFCGPAAFGQHLACDLRAHGLAAKHFHQELFNMR